MNSAEALEKMCELHPDHPIKYGIGKTAAGLGLCGAGIAGGALGWSMRDMVTDSYDTVGKVIGMGLELIIGGCSLAAEGFGLYFLADGLTSLGKPLGIYDRDGSIFYRNGGFTNKPSISDKKFGTKVTPVERVENLSLEDFPVKDYVFANGILVKDTNLDSRTETRMIPITTTIGKTTTTAYIPQSYTVYTSVLSGELRGRPIKVFTVTEDESFADALANKQKDSKIYAFGKLDEEKDIDVQMFGEVLTK